MTISEASLWMGIRRRRLGVRFRRQVPIGKWIADFACLDPKIVIEVDDPSHELRDETARTEYLQRRGFLVLRYDNEEIAKQYNEVIDGIRHQIARVLREADRHRRS